MLLLSAQTFIPSCQQPRGGLGSTVGYCEFALMAPYGSHIGPIHQKINNRVELGGYELIMKKSKKTVIFAVFLVSAKFNQQAHVEMNRQFNQ